MEDRSTGLIADFSSEFAKGWAFAVGWFFREELGVMWGERVEDGRKVKKWIQTPYFKFKEGQVIYDSPDGYLQWSDALKKIKYVIEIIRANPDSRGDNGQVIPGYVSFRLSRPNRDKTGLVEAGFYTCTQKEFVGILKEGIKCKDLERGF